MTTLLRLGWLAKVPWSRADRFVFLDPGKLVDEELELVTPSDLWIDRVVTAAQDRTTIEQSPNLANVTRRQMTDFLSSCPMGHQQGNSSAGTFPGYHFWMVNRLRPDMPIAGAIGLRIGSGPELEMYYGHVGYHVYPLHRGRHFAERSVRLLLPLARRHEIQPLWITCNPDNVASRRTCQRLGATMERIVDLPPGHPLTRGGDKSKCCFRLDVPGGC
jgi:predicted acetyltransferase